MELIAIWSTVLAVVALYFGLGASSETGLGAKIKPREKLDAVTLVDSKFKALPALMEIPDFSSLLWFAVSAGESLENALRIAVSRSSGFVSGEFSVLLLNVDHGALLYFELQNLATSSRCEQVRELATKLAVSLNNGSALASMLGDFVQSSTAQLRGELLTRAGKNETKMMIPLVFVILPVTVLFAVYPSLSLIQGSFL